MGGRALPSVTKAKIPTKGAPNLLGKSKGEKRGCFHVFTPLPMLFFSLTVPSTLGPIYCLPGPVILQNTTQTSLILRSLP